MQFAGETDLPMLYYSDDLPEQDFEDLAGDAQEALHAWRSAMAGSRAIVEYARHAGHADLLRERIDGRTGRKRASRSGEKCRRNCREPPPLPTLVTNRTFLAAKRAVRDHSREPSHDPLAPASRSVGSGCVPECGHDEWT